MAVAESGPAIQNRGILTALRAAAVLIIATGLNDVIAGAVPRYEPLYLYLAAVALVVLLDGVILGTITAVVAAAFYALLFMPRPDALSTAVLLPLGIAIAVVIVFGIVRALFRMRRRAVPVDVAPRTQAQALLASPLSTLDQTDVLDAIAELREELRERESMLRDALRMAEEENARLTRLADLERAERMHLETAARDQANTLVARVTELELSGRQRLDAAHAESAALRQNVDELRRTADAHRDRAIRAEELLSDVTSSHSEAERLLKERMTQAATRATELENELGKVIEEREATRAEGRGAAQRVHALEGELTTSHARIGELEEELVDAVGAQSEAERALAESHARVAELEEGRVTAAAEREALRAAARSLSERLHTLDADLTASRARVYELEASSVMASAERERTLAERESELTKVVDERDSLRVAARSLTERVGALDGELTASRARVRELEASSAISAEHEATLAKAIEERDSLRAAAHSLTAKVSTLDAELAAALDTAGEARAEVVRLTAHAGVLEEQLQVASAEARALLLRAHEAEEALNRANLAFDEKLNTIVAHLAEDHEADLGKALEDKEEARAEVRSLTMRLSSLQKRFDELRDRFSEIERARSPLPNGAIRPRVLIAHPDADLRMSARASLERAGYEILSAGDGLEALRTANAERPDVVIADAVMPKMDGRELCQLLKSQPKTAHIRVILLTRGNEDPSKGDLPPDGVLRKPVPLEMLKSTLASLLASRQP